MTLVDRIEELEATVASLTAEVESLRFNQEGDGQLWQLVRDHEQRFDTLQTAWWKRMWFRIDGWPGRRDLNADRRAWRPWHRREPGS
jgi:hypothetical protein